MVRRFAWAFAIASSLTSVALAQPVNGSGKVDAKALLQSGVKLLEAKDYLGALAVFRDAYARFPSARILLNIGTTLTLLDRKADAANAYQRYLDSPDADAVKRSDVITALADLDTAVGTLEISVTPDDAQVQVTDGEWQPATQVKKVRVPPGAFTVRARKDKFNTDAKSAQIVAGDKAAIVIALTALPEDAPAKPVVVSNYDNTTPVDGPEPGPPEPRSRIGVVAAAHIDVAHGGVGGLVGPTFDATERLELQAAAILGPTYGGYAGASFAILTGDTRPFVALGVPMFFSDGMRVGGRGAGGLELRFNRQISVFAEAGVEVMANPGTNIVTTAFIPSIGATGRL